MARCESRLSTTAQNGQYLGLFQMFETEPERHLVFGRGIDINHDDVITRAEVDDSVIALLVSADITLFDGERYAPRVSTVADSISVAFGIHLTPCPAGNCPASAPTGISTFPRRSNGEPRPCW